MKNMESFKCVLLIIFWIEYWLNVFTLKAEFSLDLFNETAIYANNSVIDIRLIGQSHEISQDDTYSGALDCHTDDTTCCRKIDDKPHDPQNGTGRGVWYYPNGTVVPIIGYEAGFLSYQTKAHMAIRFHRIGNDYTLPYVGTYRCEIPGAGGITITRYITLERTESCGNLTITNGSITYTPPYDISATRAGTIATYSCSPGYQLVGGSSLRACGPNGTWNGTEPSCQVVSTVSDPTMESTSPSTMESTSTSTTESTSTSTTESTSTSTMESTSPSTMESTPPSTMESTSTPTMKFTSPSTMESTSTSTMKSTSPSTMESTSPSTMESTSPSTVESTSTPTMKSTSPSTMESTSTPTMKFTSPSTIESTSTSTIVTSSSSSDDEGILSYIIALTIGAIVIAIILFVVAIVLALALIVLKRNHKSASNDKHKQTGIEMNEHLNDVNPHIVENITQKAPLIVEFPSSEVKCTEGEMVQLRVRVSGEPTSTINWYHDGVAVRTDQSREIDEHGGLTFPSVESDHSVVSYTNGITEKEVAVRLMSDDSESSESGETSKPVPVSEFGVFVSERHAQGNKMFTQMFQSLDSGEKGHMISVAVSKGNKPANRFKNITVYDDNRVVLQPLPGVSDCQTDYINASYIDGYTVSKKFIASQGPLPHTVVDFWRMVWQERPSAIVMLTNCEEGGRIKCEQYWPESGSKSYGPFQIIITDKQILADYVVRSFILTDTDGNTLKLAHFHFTAWPDHGVPEYATPILGFQRRIRAHHVPSTGPLIVHCSAGVGRTGTYITLDNVLDQIEAEGLVDIDGIIVKMRNQRKKMVQTEDQYIFIHNAILEFLTCGDTQISSGSFRIAISKLSEKDSTRKCTGYQHQFNVLDQVSPSPTEVNCSTALNHPDKNRGDKYLPLDKSRVILSGEQPDYIHAVAANGYKHRKAYIIAQNPLKSTIRNFWKVIVDKECAVIIMLSQVKEIKKEACAVYWPEEGGAAYGEFKVDISEKEEFPDFKLRKLVISDFNTHQSHQVTQFHVTNWSPDGTCSNLKVITDVIEEVAKIQRKTGNNPIMVHCSDTVSRSGMFCAIATTIDRCKTEGVVDVFQVVKALRIHKPGAVLNVNQYKLIHEAVLTFLESFDSYANFKAV